MEIVQQQHTSNINLVAPKTLWFNLHSILGHETLNFSDLDTQFAIWYMKRSTFYVLLGHQLQHQPGFPQAIVV